MARVAMPGGDNIGSRKLDMHFRALEAMGAELEVVHGFIDARCNALVRRPRRARVPERRRDRDGAHRGGARQGRDRDRERGTRARDRATSRRSSTTWARRSSGAGTSTITIEGVDELHPVEHSIVGDRIEAGTSLIACGVGGRRRHGRGHRSSTSRSSSASSTEMGVEVDRARPTGCTARAEGRCTCGRRADAAVPGVRDRLHAARRRRCSRRPTARRSSPRTSSTTASRSSTSCNRMGADIRTEGRHAVVRGVPRLSGAPCAPSTCAPAPRSCSRASPPTARRPSSIPTTSTGATPTSRRKLPRRSAPTSERRRRR